MSVPEILQTIFSSVDNDKNHFISNLKEAVSIQSVSAWSHKRDEIRKMAEYLAKKLRQVGAQTEIKELGFEVLDNGQEIPLAPVLIGTLASNISLNRDQKKRKMVLVYGHMDVQPALKKDGWSTDPFVLTNIDDKLYGRGSSDDKGPILAWINALETYQKLNIDIPIDIKFIFEGMEEVSSKGLKEFLDKEKNDFLKDVDYVCITDSRWLGTEKACLTYGLRGNCYFLVKIEGASKDLHSGVFGGTVYEAMTDLVYLLSQLVSTNGEILIPHINDDVEPLSKHEKDIYKDIDFNVTNYKEYLGSKKLIFEEKEALLMHRWRYPSLSIHGIEGAFSESGVKTVIPKKVIGKFSIRTVPNQKPEKIIESVKSYLLKKHEASGSPNKLQVDTRECSYWLENPNHPHYEVARRATKFVYGYDPDLIREGSTVPPALMLKEILGRNVLILPIGKSDDNAHAENEKIDVENYIQGTKLLAAYIYEMGRITDE